MASNHSRIRNSFFVRSPAKQYPVSRLQRTCSLVASPDLLMNLVKTSGPSKEIQEEKKLQSMIHSNSTGERGFFSTYNKMPKFRDLLLEKQRLFGGSSKTLKLPSISQSNCYFAPLKRHQESQDMKNFREKIRIEQQKQRIFKSVYSKSNLLLN